MLPACLTTMTADDHRRLVTAFYEEAWNGWNLATALRILAPDLVFRGSLGDEVHGPAGFLAYRDKVRDAFPDFHNRIDELVADGTAAAACLTYSGTHRGTLFGRAPTGHRIEYAGMAFFAFADGSIVRVRVLGDLNVLLDQLDGK